MARVQKRTKADGTTVYVAKWRLADGRDRSKGGFSTKKAARDFATQRESEASMGIGYDPGKGRILFRDAAAIWLESREHNVRNNAGNHRAALAPAHTRRGDGRTVGIDAVFGGVPLNKITRQAIQDWVNQLTKAGKAPSTVRHAFWTVRMVLEQCVIDGRIPANPAQHVKLPTERSASGKVGIVGREQFLTADQVEALTDATPWPYNVYAHVAAWSGLRAAELCGLQVQDVELPADSHGSLRVERTWRQNAYGPTKTANSFRRVPLPGETSGLLAEYLAAHPHRGNPTAPLFPAMRLVVPRPTGLRSKETGDPADRQAAALAALTVAEAESRLVLDWSRPLQHPNFYKAVFRPAVLRAIRIDPYVGLPAGLKFHSLRHTYASLCGEAKIPVRQVAEFMGHASPTTTELIYTHIYRKPDHSYEMAALGAMAARATRKPKHGNVIRLRG